MFLLSSFLSVGVERIKDQTTLTQVCDLNFHPSFPSELLLEKRSPHLLTSSTHGVLFTCTSEHQALFSDCSRTLI